MRKQKPTETESEYVDGWSIVGMGLRWTERFKTILYTESLSECKTDFFTNPSSLMQKP